MEVMAQAAARRSPERVIFCGAGRWGKNLIQAFVARGAVPAGFAVRSNSTMRQLAAEYPHVPVDTDAERLISGTDADVVVVATPTDTHGRLAQMALYQGRDVFVEKPLCTDPVEAHALANAARRGNTALFTGFVYLYHPAFAALRRAVAKQTLEQVRFSWTRPGLAGPPVWELLPHELAIASALLGELPDAVSIDADREKCCCTWTSGDGRRIDIRLDGRAGTCKRKEVAVRTASGEVWQWTNHELVRRDREPHAAVLQRTTFEATEPLRREVEWFFAHRSCADAVRQEIDRSVTITTVIHDALADAAPRKRPE